jgi:integrase/recombinase XerD
MPRRQQKKPPRSPAPGSDPLGMPALIAAHVDWMRERNYSEVTVHDRIVHLESFTSWCRERGLTRPSEITRPILELYQRFIFHYRKANGRPLSFPSQHDRLCSIRTFFKYLARANHLLGNPAADLDLPRIPQRLPRAVLTAAEAEEIIAQAHVHDALGLRDRAIMETFYSTGMRRKELASLAVYDLDQERGTVMIREGKGKKDRMIPIGERALAWIAKYLADVRPTLVVEPDPGTLFLTSQGEPLTLMWLTDRVRDYVRRADVGKQGGCHLFRHTMATLMLEGGADVRYIQEMLGHADLKTTQIYTRVSIRALKAIHSATHPAAKMGRKGEDESNAVE